MPLALQCSPAETVVLQLLSRRYSPDMLTRSGQYTGGGDHGGDRGDKSPQNLERGGTLMQIVPPPSDFVI